MSNIKFRGIRDVSISSKADMVDGVVTKVTFVTDAPLSHLGALLELAASGARMDVVVSTPQTAFIFTGTQDDNAAKRTMRPGASN